MTPEVSDLITYIRCAAGIAMDGYMLWLFLALFKLFISQRTSNLTSYNRRVIVIVYNLWGNCVFQSIISSIVFTLSLLSAM